MIDLANEKLLTIPEAAARVPAGPGGRPTHANTIRRWMTQGVRGVKLEAAVLGSRWVTSAEALQRFADRMTEARLGPARPREAPDPDPKKVAATKAALAALGVR